MFISCKQCYVPSIGISQVSAIFYLKSIGIGSAGENWYRSTTNVQYLPFLLPMSVALVIKCWYDKLLKKSNPICHFISCTLQVRWSVSVKIVGMSHR